MRDPGRTSSPVPRAQSRQRHRCGQLRTRSCRQAGRRRCLPAAGWGKAASGSRCPLRTRRCNTRLPSPMRSPQKSMGALSFSPSPMTTTPSKEMEPSTCARARAREQPAAARTQSQHCVLVSRSCRRTCFSHRLHGRPVRGLLVALAKPVRSGQRGRFRHANLQQGSTGWAPTLNMRTAACAVHRVCAPARVRCCGSRRCSRGPAPSIWGVRPPRGHAASPQESR